MRLSRPPALDDAGVGGPRVLGASDEPALADYLAVLRRRWLLIAASAAGVIAVAVAIAQLQSPVYRAAGRVLVQPGSSLFAEPKEAPRAAEAQRILSTQVQILKSTRVRAAVEQSLGRAAPDATAKPVGQADIIEVTAEDTDPGRAAAVVDAYMTAYQDFRRRQDAEILAAPIKEVRSKVDELQRQIAAVDRQIAAAPPDQQLAAQIRFEPQRSSIQERLTTFQQRLDELEVQSAVAGGKGYVLTPAEASGSPVRPKPAQTAALAAVVGLLFSLGLALVVDYVDDTVGTSDDIADAGVPVLAAVPAGGGRLRHRAASALARPNSAAAEAYRSLRTALQFVGSQREMFSVQVVSTGTDGEEAGAAANLAASVAAAGQRVVAVGGNLRRPRLQESFGIANTVGLSSVLGGGASLEEALVRVDDRLSVLPAGPVPPNPSELIGSAAMVETLDGLRTGADLVVVDSAPAAAVTDAAVLATLVDASVMVARAGVTRRRDVFRAIEELEGVGARVVGVVLVGTRTSARARG